MAKTLSIDDFTNKTEQFLSLITNQLPDINSRVAVTALSILKQRIIDDGLSSKGTQLGKYSDSYTKWRKFNNLQTNHIDLKASGNMWRDIGVVSSELKGNTAITVVTAINSITRKGGQKTEDIMFANAERYGDFMSLSEDEEEQIAELFDAELQLIIDKTFGRD